MSRTITLRHLDNREFARIQFAHFGVTAAIIDAICFEFECDEDAIKFEENEDDELISVYGQTVAQTYVTWK